MNLPSSLSRLLRFFFLILLNSVGIYVLSRFLSGVHFASFVDVIIATFTLSIVNAIIFPIFVRFALPITVLTLGFGALILDAIAVLFVSSLLKGFQIDDALTSLVFVFAIAIINAIITSLLAIDDEDTYYRNVIKRQAQRKSKRTSKIPGVIFIQIDGLSYEVLRRAIQSGNVPNITSWIREGNHRLERWETDWSSQTGASQAGILMGSNKNIPAFRWFDKKLGRTIAFGNPSDLKYLEKKLSNGKGLLFHNGASRGNLFSGDAAYRLLTVSSIGKRDKEGVGHGYRAYFTNPYNLPRTITLFFVDVFREVKSIFEQRRRNVWPRLTHHQLVYPFLRASITIVQRDILFQTLIGDIYEGRDTVYADFVGYDEVSHHTGPERYETLAILRDLDKQIGRIKKATEDGPRPYHLVILSDHGQTQGATFKQMNGFGLDEFVEKSIGGEVASEMRNRENKNAFRTAVVEISSSGGLVGKSLGKVENRREKIEDKNTKGNKSNDVVVLASGALGLIYFTKIKHRLTLEEIDDLYPELVNDLISHPLVGFVLVNTKKHGGVVIGKNGQYILKSDKVIGENPLSSFGGNALTHVKRTNSFNNVGDIMVNSIYDPVMSEVHAFEELVGSHGAMGGDQVFPFVLFPSNWTYPKEHIIGAENLHKQMKKWLKTLGQKV